MLGETGGSRLRDRDDADTPARQSAQELDATFVGRHRGTVRHGCMLWENRGLPPVAARGCLGRRLGLGNTRRRPGVRSGFTKKVARDSDGAMSCNNCKRFGSSSADIWVNPVVLSAGWASDATKPCSTGSLTCMNTTGILRVAASRAFVPAGRRSRRPRRAAGHSRPLPSGIRSPRSVPRRSRFRSAPGGTQHLGRNRADAAEEADHRHRLLLRAQGARRGHRPPYEEE